MEERSSGINGTGYEAGHSSPSSTFNNYCTFPIYLYHHSVHLDCVSSYATLKVNFSSVTIYPRAQFSFRSYCSLYSDPERHRSIMPKRENLATNELEITGFIMHKDNFFIHSLQVLLVGKHMSFFHQISVFFYFNTRVILRLNEY
jgi:hypothetical protein